MPLFLLLVSLVASACGGSVDPQEELAAAVKGTFEGSFAFEFTVDADQSALAALGEGAGQAAFFLSGFKVAGATEGDNTRLVLQLLSIDVVEARAIGDDAVYLRLGLEDVAALTGTPVDAEALAGQLDDLGLDPAVRETVVTALEGDWIGVEGALDAERLQSLFGGEGAPDEAEVESAFEDNFGADLPAFIERFVTVSERSDEDGQQTFRVDLQVRELLRAAADLSQRFGERQIPLDDLEADLEELPATIPGTIIASGGRIDQIRFDLGEAARRSGQEVEGRIDLTLALTDHGEVAAIDAPEGADVLTGEQFTDAVAQVMGFLTGLGA
jgi:hypothetical protein